MTTLKTTLTTALLALGMTMGSAAFAADKCKNFDIMVDNHTGYQAKVTKFEYYDYDKTKWRTETLTQRVLQNNVRWTWNRGLEHVKNDDTKFRITFKEKYGGAVGGYSAPMKAYSNKFKCHSNGSKVVDLY